MDNLLDTYQIPKLNQDEINHLNSPITHTEIEVIKSLPTKKRTQDQMVLVQSSIRSSKKTYYLYFSNFSTKIETESPLQNSFYEATITLIPEPQKDPTKKENFRTISLMNINTKIHSKILVQRT